jgi:hypothetical protein
MSRSAAKIAATAVHAGSSRTGARRRISAKACWIDIILFL